MYVYCLFLNFFTNLYFYFYIMIHIICVIHISFVKLAVVCFNSVSFCPFLPQMQFVCLFLKCIAIDSLFSDVRP